MTDVCIEFDTCTDAFAGGYPGDEIARILREIADAVEDQGCPGRDASPQNVLDANDCRIGRWRATSAVDDPRSLNTALAELGVTARTIELPNGLRRKWLFSGTADLGAHDVQSAWRLVREREAGW